MIKSLSLSLGLVTLASQPVTYASLTKESLLVGRASIVASNKKLHQVRQVVHTSLLLEGTCLPGVFRAEDYIAMAIVESELNPRAIGKAGERGIWQILHWKQFKGDAFNVSQNGNMMCHILRSKHKRWGDHKRALQAYNGLKRNSKRFPYYNRVTSIKGKLVSSL